MPVPLSTVRERLELNRTVFLIAMAFFYAGLFSGIVADLAVKDWLIYATDVLALLVFITSTFLALRRKISYGLAILICLIQTCFNFSLGSYVIFLFHSDRPLVGFANPQFLLIFGVFGAVAGIAISRWAAVILGLLGLGTICLFTVDFHNSWYYQHWLGLDVVIVAGSMTIVFYYRTVLEHLVSRLAKSLREVATLQVKAEELHELNKPFVVFGQNTAGLVHDFQNDVLVLANELAMLRRTEDYSVSGKHLAIMTESVRNLNRRIEWVKYVASATPQREEEILDIAKLVDSAIYPFRLQPEYRSKVQFQVSVENGLAVGGYRRWLLQVIENLIRGACQAGARTIRINAQSRPVAQEQTLCLVLNIADDGTDSIGRLESKEHANALLAASNMGSELLVLDDFRGGITATLTMDGASFLDGF